MVIQLLLGGHSKAGGDDGQDVRTQALRLAAEGDGVSGADASGARIYGNPALHLIDGRLQHADLLVHVENVALAVGAKGEDTMHASGNEPLDLAAHLIQVHTFVGIHRGQDRRDNAFDRYTLHDYSLLCNFVYFR